MWIKTIVLIGCVVATLAADKQPKKKEDARDKRNLQYNLAHHYSPHAYRRISTGPQIPLYHSQFFPGPRSYSPYHKGRPHSLPPPPYAVQMEPLVHYSQRDPLYDTNSLSLNADGQDDLLTDNNHLSENSYGPQKHVVERPVYIKDPEPIIEIIIKESNVTLPPPPAPPTPPPKKKEQVQVFYVKYKKNPNGHGKESIIYDKPVAAISPQIHHEEEEVAPPQVHHQEVVTSPPLPSTTLRTIIRPDSETYHSPSGVKVTFGKEGFDYDKRSSKPEDLKAASDDSRSVQFPQGRQLSSFPPSIAKRPSFPYSFESPGSFRQPQPYRPFTYREPTSQSFPRPGPQEYSTLPKFPPLPQPPKSGQSFPPPRPVPPQFHRQPVPYQPFESLRQQPQFRPETHFPITQAPPVNDRPAVFNQFSQKRPQFSEPKPQAQPKPQLQQKPKSQYQQSVPHFQQPTAPQYQQPTASQIQPQPLPLVQAQSELGPQNQQPSPHLPEPTPQFQRRPTAPQQQNVNQYQQPTTNEQQFNLQQQPSQQFNPQHQQFNNPQQFNAQFSLQHSQPFSQQHQEFNQQQQLRQINQQPQQPSPQFNRHQQSQQFNQQQQQPQEFNQQQQQSQQFNHQQQPSQQFNRQQQPSQQFNHQQQQSQQFNHQQQQSQQFNHQQQQSQQFNPPPSFIPPGGELIQSVPKFEQHISGPLRPSSQSRFETNQPQYNPQPQLQQSSIQLTSTSTNFNDRPKQPQSQSQQIPNDQIQQQLREANAFQESIRQSDPQFYNFQQSQQLNFYQTTSKPSTYSTTPTTTTVTSTTTQKPSTTTKDPKILNAQLPDEVPDDLREQLLSSGILNNAQISILDYDKVGDIPLSALPPDQLANFYNAGGAQQIQTAGSDPVPAFADREFDTEASEIHEVKVKPEVEMKVVKYDPESEKGQQVQKEYIQEDAKQVEPVALNDEKFNRYLPLKVSGAQFPIPDVPELKGKKITSVVVLAPVAYDFSSSRQTREAKNEEIELLKGQHLKTLLKEPTKENFKKFLDQENKTKSDQQAVILLVAGPSDNTKDKEIFMYDIATQTVSKLDGELSTAFVEAAEANSGDTKASASEIVETRVPYDLTDGDLTPEGSENLESFVDVSGIPVEDDLTASETHLDNNISRISKTGGLP